MTTVFTVTKAPRQSNLELFRIIVMLLIVAHHYVVNSEVDELVWEHLGTWRSIYYMLFGMWGKTGINCFVCITSWFMCTSHITAQKLLKLLSVWYFYAVIIYFIFLSCGREAFSPRRVFALISPFGGGIDKGFVSCFILFFLLIPFLNILLHNLDQKMHLRLVVLLLGVFSVMTAIPYFSVNYNYVTWFSILYISIAYLRFHPNRFTESLKWSGVCMMVCIILSMLSSVILPNYLTAHLNRRFVYFIYYFISDSNKILALTMGVASFLFFKNLRIPYSKLINTVASTTFGILCIHANCNAMRRFLWIDLCRNAQYYHSSYYWLHSIGVVVAVFLVCSLIDYFRIRLVEPKMIPMLNESVERVRHNLPSII